MSRLVYSIPSVAGNPEDIETFAYQRNHFTILPDPQNGVPFNRQGVPFPDIYQQHVTQYAVEQASTFTNTNALPFQRFVGTYHHQIHQPQFLSVNEIIYN